jgi:hypothetical protein
MQQFIVCGRPIIIGGMKALAAIKDFNTLKHSLLDHISGLISLVVHQFSFQDIARYSQPFWVEGRVRNRA